MHPTPSHFVGVTIPRFATREMQGQRLFLQEAYLREDFFRLAKELQRITINIPIILQTAIPISKLHASPPRILVNCLLLLFPS